MPSKWIDHIKSYAKQHGLSYGCALSDPNCSKTYKEKNNTTVKTKPIAKPMAAVKTLTSAPKAPQPPKPNSNFINKKSNKSLLKDLPKEWLEYFNKGDYDNTRIEKIALLKDGVKFDKNISHRDLNKLYMDNYRKKHGITLND